MRQNIVFINALNFYVSSTNYLDFLEQKGQSCIYNND